MLEATPSGMMLAPESGAHQSIGTPLVGMAQDGLAAFEPAFVDELAAIIRFGFECMQRDGRETLTNAPGYATRPGGGGALSAPVDMTPPAAVTDDDDGTRACIIDGTYWLRKPGPNAQVVVAYQGAVAPRRSKPSA